MKYPDSWTLEEDSDCTTLYKSLGGVGAIQISAYETDVPQSAEASLREYFVDEGIVITAIDQYQKDEQVLACSAFESNGSYTRVCFLCKGARLLFLTYNCDAASKVSEMEDVDEIIHSMTIKI